MIDLEIRYPSEFDVLPITNEVSVNLGENINSLRDAILNLERVLGLDVNIGLFTPTPAEATVAGRLTRIERGIAERNLVFREINVSDVLTVLLNPNNDPSVKIGRGEANNTAPVTIRGPLTILSPELQDPRTIIQTPVEINVTTFNPNASSRTLIKGKSNFDQPLLTIQDTNTDSFIQSNANSLALRVIGNMTVTGRLTADFSVDHNKVLNIETVPTDQTRGSTRHVTQGDYHSHRKGRFDQSRGAWTVDSSTNPNDFGIIRHSDLVGIGTLPTDGDEFVPVPGTAYHVTGGDLHSHKNGDGAQIDHSDLKNVNPKFSNHVTGGDSHDHTGGAGAQIDHRSLRNIGTSGADDIHVPRGGNHRHEVDEEGNTVGDGGQIAHGWLSGIDTTGADALHVTGGDSHSHDPDLGDGAQIDHTKLSNIGEFTHEEIDEKINSFRRITTGTAAFTTTNFNEITITHNLGTDQFNLMWTLSSRSSAPPSDPADVGVIYVDNNSKNSSTVRLKRAGGASVGPAVKATLTTSFLTPNSNLQYISRKAGTEGNNTTIEYRDDPGAISGSDPFNVIAVSTPASITVIFDSGSAPTANAVRSAILANPSAALIVDVLLAPSNDGTGPIEVLNDGYGGGVALTGGADSTGFTSLELEWAAIATV